MKYQKAFTLVELMVTLAIATIIAMMVTPFSDIIRKNRNLTLVQEFATALNLARSEAIKRGRTVTVCKRMTPPDALEEECDADPATTWGNGWIVFVDVDETGGAGLIRNGTNVADSDATAATDDDPVVRVHQSIPDGYTFTAPRTTIGFRSSGVAINGTATWTLCDSSRQQKYAHGVVVSMNGRVRLSEDTNGDGIRESQEDTNLVCP